MSLKKRLATVLWLGLALAASAMAAPPSPAQGHVGGGVTSLVTGVAQEDGDVSAAQAIRDAESQCGSAGAAHWALYQRLRDRSVPASPPRPDFSGDWPLNTKASDDPRGKAKEAAQASILARGGARGMGSGSGGMEAANRGAFEAGARSIGLNVTLPHEQEPNPFISPELAFRFRYFALRKMHFLLRARALVAFPGGYGTLDELFEVLTLVQTGKMARIPIVLFGGEFWRHAVNFDFLIEEGMISAADTALFTVVEKAEEAVAVLHDFYQGTPP